MLGVWILLGYHKQFLLFFYLEWVSIPHIFSYIHIGHMKIISCHVVPKDHLTSKIWWTNQSHNHNSVRYLSAISSRNTELTSPCQGSCQHWNRCSSEYGLTFSSLGRWYAHKTIWDLANVAQEFLQKNGLCKRLKEVLDFTRQFCKLMLLPVLMEWDSFT